jgi:hypothetical protein
VLIDGVDRADVHGLGTQPFFPWTVWLLVNKIHPMFIIGPKIPGGNDRTDTATDTPVVDMIPGWAVVCKTTHIHRLYDRWCMIMDSDEPPEARPDLLKTAQAKPGRMTVACPAGVGLKAAETGLRSISRLAACPNRPQGRVKGSAAPPVVSLRNGC